MPSTLKRMELRKLQVAALRETVDALDAALTEERAEKRALRNRLVAEIAKNSEGDYETRMAAAEAKVNEFEDAFREATHRLARAKTPNAVLSRRRAASFG